MYDDLQLGPQSHDWRALWNFNDPAASEARFRVVIAHLTGPEQTPQRAEVLTQSARAQGLQRRFEEAHRTLDEIEAIRDMPAFVQVRLLLERGRVLNSSGKAGEARPLFEQAYDLAVHHGEDDLAVDAAHMVAIACEGDEAMEWNLRALSMAEASRCPRARRWAGSLHNNLGWTLHALNRYDEALVHFQAALEARTDQDAQGEMLVARWCIARCLRSLGRLVEALAMQRELRAAHEAAGSTDGYVSEELGECLLALNRDAEAAPWFARAHAELSQDPWLTQREPQRLARLAQLGGSADARP